MTDRTIAPIVKSSPPPPSITNTTTDSSTNTNDDTKSTSLPLGIMILVLGSSAGMLFYTKRTGSMLRSLQTISERPLHINQTAMRTFGPATKQDTEKMRSRIDKDDFF